MRQKIDVKDLKPGMYVSALDRPWRETPFLFQGFHIQSRSDIAEIRKYCQFVFVEVSDEEARACLAPAQDKRLAQRMDLLRQSGPNRREPDCAEVVALHEEMQAARDTLLKCRETIGSILEDACMGRGIAVDGARRNVERMAKSVVRNPDALMCLTQIRKKDEYTLAHSLRVSVLALTFGRHLGLPQSDLIPLGLGALLHDVGKARVPDEVLNKPDRLSEQEYRIMQSHVPEGVKILEKCRGVPPVAVAAAAQHHERFNGKGYVYGLQGDQISDLGMITAIVDCYDAVTSDRMYRDGISAHRALKQMYQWRHSHFHAGLVEQFIQCMGIYPVGSLVELNTGHVGVVIGINRRKCLRPRVNLILDAGKNPYAKSAAVDLAMQTHDEVGCAWEIKAVLEPGAYGLNPALLLPKLTAQQL